MQRIIFMVLDTDKSDSELLADVQNAVREMQDTTSDGDGTEPAITLSARGSCRCRFSERVDVLAFQQKFRVPMAQEPSWLPEHLFEFRYKFLQEELQEFFAACAMHDMHGAADALVDLSYVLHGTALMMGLPWPMLWEEVQRKNMQKERAKHAGESKRGSSFDVVKPAGWTPPDHTEALGNGPWPTLKAED